jgi:hypothetical protein
MQQEAVEALPPWAQIIFYVATALGFAVFGLRQYAKSGNTTPATETPKDEPKATVVAGAIFDGVSMQMLSRALKDTADRVEEAADQVKAAQRGNCDCINELTDAVRDLTRLIKNRPL